MAETAKAEYETVLLRRKLPVKPGLKRVLVYVSGPGQSEMTLNGKNAAHAGMDDLRQDAAIIARIGVTGPAGSQVKVTPSELINDKGDINDRMTKSESYCTYTRAGRGEETYEWKFYCPDPIFGTTRMHKLLII